jgi:hypothetical protein
MADPTSYTLIADGVSGVEFTRATWNAAQAAETPDGAQDVLNQVSHVNTDMRGFYATIDTVQVPVNEGDILIIRDTLIEEVWDPTDFAAKWE